jgi:hypothetical protein
LIGWNSRFVQEVLAATIAICVAPLLRIWIERQPVDKKEGKSFKLFDQWRMLGIESKVSRCEIRVASGEMCGLVNRLRIGPNEKNSLREKNEQKKQASEQRKFSSGYQTAHVRKHRKTRIMPVP